MLKMRKPSLLILSLPCLLLLANGCSDDTSSGNEQANDDTSTGTSTNDENTESNDEMTTTGDGDGDTGDGDGDGDDGVGDGDGDTGDGDGDTGDGDGDTGDGDGDGDTGDGDGDGDTGDGDGDTGDGDGDTGDGDGDPCNGGMGGFDFSYLWVANTDQGSVSKVNTQTMVEEGRYRTGPNGVYHSPSRTTVSLDGRFAMVGNRNSQSVTLVAANEDDCIDKNNDGQITTSLGPNNLLDWEQDECVLWRTVLPDVGPGETAGPRGMTFDPGELNQQTCKYENPKIWVGWHGAQADMAHMGRLDPTTGAVEEVVDIPNFHVGAWASYPPYGAAYDGIGNVWFTALRGNVFRLNTESLVVDRWALPGNGEAYGMTVDPEGNAWFGGCSGPVSMFDAQLQTFTAIPNTNACYRGVAADNLGNIWVASNGPCGLMQIDRETKTVIKFHNAADFNNICSTPVGVSIDVEGYVWMVDQGNPNGWAWKMDPETYEKEIVQIPGNHYTYSDMTGGGLNAVVQPQ